MTDRLEKALAAWADSEYKDDVLADIRAEMLRLRVYNNPISSEIVKAFAAAAELLEAAGEER